MLFTDYLLIAAFAVMSVVAVCVTCYDKKAARVGRWNRTPERVLMLIGFFFGSFAMYITMRIILHKTLHRKFMIGLPVFMLLHAALIVCYIVWLRPRIGA